MKKIIAGAALLTALTGCSSVESALSSPFSSFSGNPQELMEDAVKNMSGMGGYEIRANSEMELSLLAFKLSYISESAVQLEKDSASYKTLAATKAKFNGKALPSSKVYLSKDKYGIYDEEAKQWQFHAFRSDDANDAQNKFLIESLLSLYNPESSANQFLNSVSERTFKKEGTKSIGGVKCVGVSVQVKAEEFMKQFGDAMGKAGGVPGEALSGIGNAMLENTKMVYWIGQKDHRIYEYDSDLSGSFGKMKVQSLVSRFGEKIDMNR